MLKVIMTSDHFRKARMALPRAAALTSLAVSFCQGLDSYAIGPLKIMRHLLGSGYASLFSSLSAGSDSASMPVVL